MKMKKNLILSMELVRNFTLTLEPISGSLSLFYAFINGIKVIQSDGTKKRAWTGKIPDAQVRIKVRVVGIDDATFKLGIDLPGVADDQNITFKLQEGYYETEITL